MEGRRGEQGDEERGLGDGRGWAGEMVIGFVLTSNETNFNENKIKLRQILV